MLLGDNILAIGEAICSEMIGMDSLERGESKRLLSGTTSPSIVVLVAGR